MKNKLWCKLIGVILCVCVILSSVGVGNVNVLAAEGNSEYYQQLNPNSKEYREWKESLNRSSARMQARSAINSATMISNDYIEFNTSSNGRFSIGTVEGNPDVDTDNNQKMLYGHPYGSTSYTTVRIDGKSKKFEVSEVSYDAEKAESVAIAEYDGIQIVQTLSIVENENTKRDDLVKISYELKNNSDTDQSVGLRIMMDTMLGTNDAAPFRVNGLNITTETEYTGEDIPQNWMAFDSLTEPGVVSQGIIYKGEEVKPDKVQFVNWGRVSGTEWDYQILPWSSNGDSAVAMTWNEKSLEAGNSYKYCTYYGLNELTYDLAPPIALGVFVDNTTIQNEGSYDQITATAYIQNIGNGNATDVKLWMETDDNFEYLGTNDTKKISVMKPGESDTYSWSFGINKTIGNGEDRTGIIKIKLQYTEESTGNIENKEIIKNITICKAFNEKQAIVVVPGIMGSRLQDSTGNVVWLDIEALMGKMNCDEYGNSLESLMPISSSRESGTLEIYKALLDDLLNTYGNNYDIVFAPYDWRLGLDTSAAEIKKYIDNYDKVAVIAHSMGGLVLEQYIHDYGTDKILKAVSVGAPLWGSTMAARAEFDGYLEFTKGSFKRVLEGMVDNFEGVHNLLPNSYYTNVHKWCSVSTNQYESFWDRFTHTNIKTELKDWDGTKEFYATYGNDYLVNKAFSNLDQLHISNSCELDKVNTTFIVGNGCITDSDVDFFDGLISNGEGGVVPTKIAYPKTNYYGDETVSMISATINRIDASSLNSDSVQYIGNFVVVKEVDHVGLVQEDDSIDEIKRALNECVIPNPGSAKTKSISKTFSMQKKSTSNTDTNEDFEDSSRVVQLILTGDIDIDMYSQDELKYYYHPNSEDSIKDGPDFVVRNAGKFGDQNVVIVNFNKECYTIKLTSNKNQISQIGILNEQNLQTLSDFSLEEGDVVEISYSPEKSEVRYNNNKIRFEGDDSLSPEDVEIMSLDTNMEDEGNTIGVRIKLKNCSDIAIPLKEVSLGYIFNPDGFDNNVSEIDWACNDDMYITDSAKGSFTSLSNGNMQFDISFDNDEVLEVGKDLEMHFRIHTSDWQNYNLLNDYSRNTSEYSVNDRILMSYKNQLLCGKELSDESN